MIGEGLAAKIIGILAGSFLALVFIPPRSVSGFFRRATAALVFGWVFGPVVHRYTGWDGELENVAAAGAIAAFCSWWLLGVGKRLAEKLGEKEV